MFVRYECCVLSGRGLCDGWSLVQRSPTDCGASVCVIKKPRKRWGYSPTRGLQNTNPQWVEAQVEKKYFPYAWISAKVNPILQPGKPLSDTGSHRPISLLSTVSKLLERVVAHRLNSFIHQNHILPPEQFGFREQHSTVSQLARIADFITHDVNLRKHTGMVLLDIEKDYDTVWLNGLLFQLISLH